MPLIDSLKEYYKTRHLHLANIELLTVGKSQFILAALTSPDAVHASMKEVIVYEIPQRGHFEKANVDRALQHVWGHRLHARPGTVVVVSDFKSKINDLQSPSSRCQIENVDIHDVLNDKVTENRLKTEKALGEQWVAVMHDLRPKVDKLRQSIDRASADYIRTTPFCSYQVDQQSVSFDLRDILLIGAITESDVLLIGKTGTGKTKLANAVMKGLFGEKGYYAKTTLPTMNPSDFMDIDFGKLLDGGTLKGATEGIPALELPGILLNEVNRAPGVIQNMLIAFLDKEFEIQGKPVDMGRPWEHGRYQFRIMTINEGEQYKVERLDPAIRDRMTIEIPIDAFPQSREDVLAMFDAANPFSGTGTSLTPSEPDNFDAVCELRVAVESVPVPDNEKLFLAYLCGMSYCIKAPRGNKESIDFAAGVCDGCHHSAPFYNLCQSIRAPSPRVILRLQKVAKAFAFLRMCRGGGKTPALTYYDIVEAAPFVLYSKLSLEENWVRTAGAPDHRFLGDRWTAIREILDWVYKTRFLPLICPDKKGIHDFLSSVSEGNQPNTEAIEAAWNYLQNKDPWAYDPAAVQKMRRALLS